MQRSSKTAKMLRDILSQGSLVSGLFLPLGSKTMIGFLDKADALTSLSGRGSGFSFDDPRKDA